MRDYGELVKALRACGDHFDCENCPIDKPESTSDDCHKVDLDAADAIEELVAAVPEIIRCENCKFWDEPPSCEGLAKCVTGESGIRYRSKRDFCSRGMPLPAPPKEVE